MTSNLTRKPRRIFVRAPWNELWTTAGEPKRAGVTELVAYWNHHHAAPRGYKVKRWRYANSDDTVTMELEALAGVEL